LTADSVSNSQIKLQPITTSTQVNEVINVAWYGAVATFDNTSMPIYKIENDTPIGLWILSEFPPTITITTES